MNLDLKINEILLRENMGILVFSLIFDRTVNHTKQSFEKGKKHISVVQPYVTFNDPFDPNSFH